MDRLLQGYKRFRATRWPQTRDIYERLARGQQPRLLVIGCSDSRVDPSAIFDVEPGELFIIRNVANLVPPFDQGGGFHGVSAAIEFAVERLKVRTILVLGHARCGGVQAALEGEHKKGESRFLASWVSLLAPALERLPCNCASPQTELEFESILVAMENLRTFPFVAKALEEGSLELAGARFDVADGSLSVWDSDLGAFRSVEAEGA